MGGLCMFQGRSSNGTMTVGGVDKELADGAIQYAPDTGFIYNTVDVSTLTIGGQQIHVGDGAILDSGTNILLLGSSVYSRTQQAMCSDKSLVNCNGFWSNQCFDMTDSEVAMYPSLKFQLDGVELEMTSSD